MEIGERYLSLGPNHGFANALESVTGGKVVPLAGGMHIRKRDVRSAASTLLPQQDR